MGLFTPDIKTLGDLFNHTLKDIYYAEQQILKTLPTLISKATEPQLKKDLKQHLVETEGQVRRLDEVFALRGQKPKGTRCPGIDGILRRLPPGRYGRAERYQRCNRRFGTGGRALRKHPIWIAHRVGHRDG